MKEGAFEEGCRTPSQSKHGPQKPQGLLGTGRRVGRGYGSGGGGGGGKREVIYLSVYCHHQNDSCIMMGSDESHFNVSSL